MLRRVTRSSWETHSSPGIRPGSLRVAAVRSARSSSSTLPVEGSVTPLLPGSGLPAAINCSSGWTFLSRMPMSVPSTTDRARRHPEVAALVGVVAGIFSAIVKFGWEVPFPPRTPERNATNPPQQLLEQLGFSDHFAHTLVYFNGNGLPVMSFIIHFGFAIFFGVAYCVGAERFPKITLWQGVAFGVVVYVVFHVIVMPGLGTVPAPWHQPWQEHLSELLGHIVWMWSIEVVRRDLRSRITGEPDPWVEPSMTAGR
ncbi:hypothetical protein HMPREF9596_01560 [Cutibacterium acnes HL005PA3]|nr:hypothetical protein HMPREF9596_01560 [Cutibacterium acnes HL005PA3]